MQHGTDGAYRSDILDRFERVVAADRRQFIPRWIASWAYQDQQRRRGVRYGEDLPQDFYGYQGPAELLRWFNWIRDAAKPDYFDDDRIAPLVRLSRGVDERIIETAGLPYDFNDYDATVGRYNAQDYLFQNLYPVPERNRPRCILDFGAGYGRQANLWTQMHADVTYVGMDAIPLSYCLQHYYYAQIGMTWVPPTGTSEVQALGEGRAGLVDYVADPEKFTIAAEPGIYHVPTWRADLLPDGFFDMVICVQVLQEINARLLRHMLGVFHRVLKPGACLYIRDHDRVWQPAHGVDVGSLLETSGFELEFRPHVRNDIDIHGIPRVYRKRDPEVVVSQQRSNRARLEQYLLDLDSLTGGRLIAGLKALKRRGAK